MGGTAGLVPATQLSEGVAAKLTGWFVVILKL
jgi:hypothetical protein